MKTVDDITMQLFTHTVDLDNLAVPYDVPLDAGLKSLINDPQYIY